MPGRAADPNLRGRNTCVREPENLAYNAAIGVGGSVTLGFQATHAGNSAEPSAFTLNGTPCAIA
ncbi:cellulose binding domain-containing protein [Micromonospora inyonensis]|uniref:cellulose binding domain-containing protein n=1 Tax=Micromonospora inyonensis TaxID=47866 RepID=UPI00316AD3B0